MQISLFLSFELLNCNLPRLVSLLNEKNILRVGEQDEIERIHFLNNGNFIQIQDIE